MTLSELYDIIELDSPEELEYFEQFAELIECEKDIPFDLFYTVLSQAPAEKMTELTGNYMEDLSNGLPDNLEDLYTLLDSIQQRLLLLCETLDEGDTRRDYVQELYRFRQWFHKENGAAIDGHSCTVMDAIGDARSCQFSGEEHDYDFGPSMNYELGELSLNLGSFKEIDVVGGSDPEENTEDDQDEDEDSEN